MSTDEEIQGGAATEPTSLRDDLAAAFEAAETAPADTGQTAPQAPADSRARDEAGRFATKPAESAQAAPAVQDPAPTAPNDPANPEAQNEPIRPPASWSAEAKSLFLAADPVIQREVLKRERDMDKGLQDRAAELRKYEPLEQVLASHRDKFAMRGLSEAQGVQVLLAAQDMLDRDPVNGVLQLARSYGVNLHQLAQAAQGQPQGAQPDANHPLAQEVFAIKQHLAQQSQSQQQAQIATAQGTIQQFAADPARLYFPEVKGHMATLLESGEAKDLAEAYDMAVWARPDIRKLILADQSRAEQAEATKAQRAKVGAARQAAGSVTGSPSPGAAPAGGPAPSLRDALQDAWNSARL